MRPSEQPPPHGVDVSPSIGSSIDDRYRIEAELGRGAMGVVYRASEAWLERTVAIKVIAPELTSDASAPASLHREAKALASIRSQHVVAVHAFGVHKGAYFFVMEYVRGRSLKAIIAEHRAHHAMIPMHRAVTIITQIADGIGAVHAAGLVHRDIKPSNIVIEEDTGRPVLVDFGLATPMYAARKAKLAIGTPLYMAPEQTGLDDDGPPITPRTDVYALGCTAFELLAGRPPFTSDDNAELMRLHARVRPPPISTFRPDLAAFDRPLARALAKDPADRFDSCVDFAHALSEVTASASIEEAVSDAAPHSFDKDALRVLVVDDDAELSRVVSQAVHLAFFKHKKNLRVQVSAARSRTDAVRLAASNPPDLVLLDYDLPGLDGSDTLSHLRALPSGERARVVVMSDRIDNDDRWRFEVLGVQDFVTKPAPFLALVQSLQKVAERMGPADPPEEPPRSSRRFQPPGRL
jgi:serine/threonine-protein kinase